MKTLVIHPPDKTTEFLSEVYEGKDWTIINYNPTKKHLRKEIKAHDRIIMMGHGTPNGLFSPRGYVIDSTYVHYLREKYCVYMWCNADEFVLKYKLKGFYTGMIISEIEEAFMLDISYDFKYVNESNVLFTQALTKSMDSGDILKSMINEYSNKTNNPIIEYNEKRLYHT